MLPIENDYALPIESRLPESVVAGVTKLGVRVAPLSPYDWHMGSFQVSWRDASGLNSLSDPRRAGRAGGF
jgi:gamma-glutamyltranspeptidase/glutathione hydrolase